MPGPGGERLLGTFLEAVRIDSPSGEERVFGLWCAERLRALGCEVRFDDTAQVTGSDTGNLIAELAPTAEGRTVVLSAHLDTVEPGRGIEPVIECGVVRSAGDTVLGSDDKAGVAAIIEVLARLAEAPRPHGPVRVLLSTCEEVGLSGARAMSASDCSGDVCLVLDAAGRVGGLVTAAPTHHTFSATFLGKAAHAGVHPEKGRSAVLMAARAIAAMPLGRLDDQTTSNVGEISAAGETNVVPARCIVRGECRSIDAARAEQVRDSMDSAMWTAARDAGGTVEVRWVREYEGYRFIDGDPTLAVAISAVRAVGLEPRLFVTGGGSDANVLTSKGLPSVALSCGMTDVHGMGEMIAVDDLELLAGVVMAAIEQGVAS